MTSLHWLQFMLSYAIQVSLVVSAAWGLERWATASEVKTRIWTACFVSLIGLFATGLLLPHLQSFHPWSVLGPRELLAVANVQSVLGLMLLAIWVFGAGVMLVRWVVHFLSLNRFLRLCPVCSEPDRNRIERLGLNDSVEIDGRSVQYRISPEGTGAFCYQFHRPIVGLPQSLIDGDSEVLRYVLRHELTHLRTAHPLHLFLQRLVQSVLWFHPLVWMSSGRASLVREFVCDDAATEKPGTTVNYLRTLVRMVEQQSEAGLASRQTGPLENGTQPKGTLGIGQASGELGIRARRIAGGTGDQSSGSGRIFVLALALLSVSCSQFWLPTDPLASANDRWTPWPKWSATALHAFDLPVRDFQRLDRGSLLHELREGNDSD